MFRLVRSVLCAMACAPLIPAACAVGTMISAVFATAAAVGQLGCATAEYLQQRELCRLRLRFAYLRDCHSVSELAVIVSLFITTVVAHAVDDCSIVQAWAPAAAMVMGASAALPDAVVCVLLVVIGSTSCTLLTVFDAPSPLSDLVCAHAVLAVVCTGFVVARRCFFSHARWDLARLMHLEAAIFAASTAPRAELLTKGVTRVPAAITIVRIPTTALVKSARFAEEFTSFCHSMGRLADRAENPKIRFSLNGELIQAVCEVPSHAAAGLGVQKLLEWSSDVADCFAQMVKTLTLEKQETTSAPVARSILSLGYTYALPPYDGDCVDGELLHHAWVLMRTDESQGRWAGPACDATVTDDHFQNTAEWAVSPQFLSGDYQLRVVMRREKCSIRSSSIRSSTFGDSRRRARFMDYCEAIPVVSSPNPVEPKAEAGGPSERPPSDDGRRRDEPRREVAKWWAIGTALLLAAINAPRCVRVSGDDSRVAAYIILHVIAVVVAFVRAFYVPTYWAIRCAIEYLPLVAAATTSIMVTTNACGDAASLILSAAFAGITTEISLQWGLAASVVVGCGTSVYWGLMTSHAWGWCVVLAIAVGLAYFAAKSSVDAFDSTAWSRNDALVEAEEKWLSLVSTLGQADALVAPRSFRSTFWKPDGHARRSTVVCSVLVVQPTAHEDGGVLATGDVQRALTSAARVGWRCCGVVGDAVTLIYDGLRHTDQFEDASDMRRGMRQLRLILDVVAASAQRRGGTIACGVEMGSVRRYAGNMEGALLFPSGAVLRAGAMAHVAYMEVLASIGQGSLRPVAYANPRVFQTLSTWWKIFRTNAQARALAAAADAAGATGPLVPRVHLESFKERTQWIDEIIGPAARKMRKLDGRDIELSRVTFDGTQGE